MRSILTIALREWRSMFLSPLAWVLLAVLFGICAYMFNAALLQYQVKVMQFRMMGGPQEMSLTDWTVAPVLGNAAIILLLLIPLITMRLVADEKRRDTWPALASSPLSLVQILMGKYLGLLLFLLVAVGLLALMPLTLIPFGKPDWGQVLSALLGLFLLSAAFGSVGLAASSATDNPIVAAVATFGVLLLLWIAAWMGENTGGVLDQTVGYLSLIKHYQNFLQGSVSSADLVYFLLLSAAALTFARQRLAAERIQG